MKRRILLLITALMALALLVVACSPEPEVVEKIVEVTTVVEKVVEKEGQQVVVTEIVREEVVVTPTPAPVEAPMAKDPSTYTALTFGDIDTMDPNLAYDTASGTLIFNVMEPLIFFNGSDATTYVPVLAEEVPSLENGGISADGKTYIFNIREGVTFHEGGTLTPSDVAYTFQRGLIQSDPNSAQWLLLEPILGYSHCYDITESIDPECNLAGDPDSLRATATTDQLVSACEIAKAAIVADDAAGTVTFNLATPWGPFLSTLAGTWGYIIDQEWAVANGAWDGSCETWIDYYAPGSENDELSTIINGTGPYRLQEWRPGEGYTLVANDTYWRTEPAWEGGPSGVAAIRTVNINIVNEWGTRFAALQAGDAESVAVPSENESQVNPLVGEVCDAVTETCEVTDGSLKLRRWDNIEAVARTDAFMVFDIPADSPYIGSGQLDGNGIPPNFFSDIHVRRAMRYCFDYDTYIAEVQNGRGVRNNGPIIPGMLGYNPDGELSPFDLDQCAAELEQAWEGALPETGFRFQIAFNTGNTSRQTVAAIFQNSLASINSKYQVDIVGLPWPTFLAAIRSSQTPIFVSGWLEDIHDPHNWVQPFTVGTYGGRQRLPQDILDQFQALVQAGVDASDPVEREKVYFELQRLHAELALQVTLSTQTGVRYEQRYVNGWYDNPGYPGTYYYSLSLDG